MPSLLPRDHVFGTVKIRLHCQTEVTCVNRRSALRLESVWEEDAELLDPLNAGGETFYLYTSPERLGWPASVACETTVVSNDMVISQSS